MSSEQVIWRGTLNTRLPPLNHVLIERLGLEALHHSTITGLTTLGTGRENDSLATGLEGKVMVNRRLMKWIVRWDWSPALGIHVNYWYEVPQQRLSETFAFCVDCKAPRGRAAEFPPNHFYAILRMVTQDSEFNHQHYIKLGVGRQRYKDMCGERLKQKWLTIFGDDQATSRRRSWWRRN